LERFDIGDNHCPQIEFLTNPFDQFFVYFCCLVAVFPFQHQYVPLNTQLTITCNTSGEILYSEWNIFLKDGKKIQLAKEGESGEGAFISHASNDRSSSTLLLNATNKNITSIECSATHESSATINITILGKFINE